MCLCLCDDSLGLEMVASWFVCKYSSMLETAAHLYQKFLHTCQVTVMKMAFHVEAISCRQTERNTFQEFFTLESRWSLRAQAPSSGLRRIFSRSNMQKDQLVRLSKHILITFLSATDRLFTSSSYVFARIQTTRYPVHTCLFTSRISSGFH